MRPAETDAGTFLASACSTPSSGVQSAKKTTPRCQRGGDEIADR
jgi:hypothetical protein